jgi:hypothetical protein
MKNWFPIRFHSKSCIESYGDSCADSDTCRRPLKGRPATYHFRVRFHCNSQGQTIICTHNRRSKKIARQHEYQIIHEIINVRPASEQNFIRIFAKKNNTETINSSLISSRLHGTHRGESLVDRHNGLDFYLLETPVNEIYALGLLRLKREILIALAKETLHPNDAGKKTELLAKYKRFILPLEEADWHGLSINQAREKQWHLEALDRDATNTPLKAEFRRELVGMLKSGSLDDIDPQLLETL